MESCRTRRGPRQRVVAYLDQLDESDRLDVKNAAEGSLEVRQKQLFDDTRPHWVEVDVKRLRVENRRDFGGPWLGLQLVEQLGLKDFLDRTIPDGREEIPWSLMALVLILCRLCEPSNELHIAEHFYARSALADLLGISPEKINEWAAIGVIKEKAMHERFERRIAEELQRIAASCEKQRQQPLVIAQRLGRLMGQNSRAAGLFRTEVKTSADGLASLHWEKTEQWRDWAALSEGCYLLRSNVTDWSDEDLWKAYIQLTEAEAAFRIRKSDLGLRPIWHQKEDRVLAHILVCFLAYVLWKTLGQRCQRAGLRHEPRRVFEELGKIQLVDVVLPTRHGPDIRRRCVTQPTDHQAILLARLKLNLPTPPLTDGA
jgi:hypothetical protein